MPTNLKRYTINLPPDLQTIVERDAINNQRPVANQVIWVVSQYYARRKEESDLFIQSPLREAKQDRRVDVPVYTAGADPQHSEQVSKLREKLGRE